MFEEFHNYLFMDVLFNSFSFHPTQEFSIIVMHFLTLLNTSIKHGLDFILYLVSETWSPAQCVLLLDKLSSGVAQFPFLWRNCLTSSCIVQPWTSAVTQGVIIFFPSFLLSLILDKNELSYKCYECSRQKFKK